MGMNGKVQVSWRWMKVVRFDRNEYKCSGLIEMNKIFLTILFDITFGNTQSFCRFFPPCVAILHKGIIRQIRLSYTKQRHLLRTEQIVLYVQEGLTHFYDKLLYDMDQDFLTCSKIHGVSINVWREKTTKPPMRKTYVSNMLSAKNNLITTWNFVILTESHLTELRIGGKVAP